MSIVVIAIDPLSIKKTIKRANAYGFDYDVTLSNEDYSIYVFLRLGVLFYNLTVTLFLSVILLFISFTLYQIKNLQVTMIELLNDDRLSGNQYKLYKNQVLKLMKQSYYPMQVLTLVAFINLIAGMFWIWYEHYAYITMQGYSYSDMVYYNFVVLPLLLKEIVFFFAILLNAASINSLNDKLLNSLASMCWKVFHDKDKYNLYSAMYIDSTQYPINFSLLTLKVKKRQIVFVLIGYLLYTLIFFMRIKSSVVSD